MIGDTLPFGAEDRGQSEVLGFGIAFASVIAITIALSVSAPVIIDDAKNSQGAIGMQQNFVLLDDNVQEVMGGVSTRKYTTEMPAGTLSQGGNTEIIISGASNTKTIKTTPVTYRNGDGDEIVYEGIGFIGQLNANTPSSNAYIEYQNENAFRDNEGSVNANRNVLIVPALKATENQSLRSTTRSSTIEYNITHIDKDNRADAFEFEGDGSDVVDVTVNTGNPDMWRVYFEKSTLTENVNIPSDGRVTAEIQLQSNSDRLVVTTRELKLGFY